MLFQRRTRDCCLIWLFDAQNFSKLLWFVDHLACFGQFFKEAHDAEPFLKKKHENEMVLWVVPAVVAEQGVEVYGTDVAVVVDVAVRVVGPLSAAVSTSAVSNQESVQV